VYLKVRTIFIKVVFHTLGVAGKPFIKILMNKRQLVFLFHDINNKPSEFVKLANIYIDEVMFQNQIHWITSNFRIVNPRELTAPNWSGSAVITFDDGFRSYKSIAFPLMKEIWIPSLVFVNKETIKGGVNSSALARYMQMTQQLDNNWRDSNPDNHLNSIKQLSAAEVSSIKLFQGDYLTIDDLTEISKEELVTIGSHLDNHWYAPSLRCEDLESSIKSNAEFVCSFDNGSNWLAMPHGVLSEQNLKKIRSIYQGPIFLGKGYKEIGNQKNLISRVDMSDKLTSELILIGAVLWNVIRRQRSITQANSNCSCYECSK